MNTTVEMDGKPIDLNDPLAEQAANAVHGTIGNFQMHAEEAIREAQSPLIAIFYNKSTTNLRIRGFTSTYIYKMRSIEKCTYF